MREAQPIVAGLPKLQRSPAILFRAASAISIVAMISNVAEAASVCISDNDLKSLQKNIGDINFSKIFKKIGDAYVKEGDLYKCPSTGCDTSDGTLVKSVAELNGILGDYTAKIKETMHGTATGGDVVSGSQSSGGAFGPPAITTLEISNNQAEEFVRQRRELAQEQSQQVAALAVPPQTPQPSAVVASAPQSPSTSAPPVVQLIAPQGASAPAAATKQSAAAPTEQVTAASPSPVPQTPTPVAKVQPAPKAAQQVAKTASAPKAAASANPNEDVATSPRSNDGRPIAGTWAQVYSDYERHTNLSPGSADNPTRVTRTTGVIAGSDLTFSNPHKRVPGAFQIGLLGGHNSSRSKFRDTPNVTGASQVDEGGFLGGYATYQKGRFAIDTIVKADFFDHTQRAVLKKTVTTTVSCEAGKVLLLDLDGDQQMSRPEPNVKAGKVDEHNYSAAANTYYRFDLGNRWYLEPTAGVRYTYTQFGSGAADLNLTNGQVWRVQAGARIGTTQYVGGYLLNLSLLGLLYSDVSVTGFTLSNDVFTASVSNVDQGKLRALGQLNTKLDVGNGLSYTGQVDVRGGKDVIGVGGRLGLRYEW